MKKKTVPELKKDVESAINSLKKAKGSDSPSYLTPIENGILVCLQYCQHQLEKEEKKSE